MADGRFTEVVASSRRILDDNAKTFALAGKLLPPAVLDDAAVVYAMCRVIDDAVDEAADAEAARQAIDALTAELSGEAQRRPLVACFVETCERLNIPFVAAAELAKGVASDVLAAPVRMTSDRELLRYCYRVAGTVGLMMSGVLGVSDPKAAAHAIDLGVGMQLTNICRDVLEDARNDRVYLPTDRLARYGATPGDVIERPHAVFCQLATHKVVEDLLVMADRYYESGRAGLRYIPPTRRAAIAGAGAAYRRIGDVVRSRAFDVGQGRAVVSLMDKLLQVVGSATVASIAGFTPEPDHDEGLHIHLAGLPGAAV